MKIDIASDLHVDAWHHQTVLADPTARKWLGEPFKSTFLYIDWARYRNHDSNVLVLAGDIANNLMITKEVLTAAADEYQHVIFVEGNHDHYENNMTVEDGMEFFNGLISHLPNVHYLKFDQTFELNGVLFCGATGWYDYKAYEDKGISEHIARSMWRQHSRDAVYPKFNLGSPDTLGREQVINLSNQVRLGSQDQNINDIIVVTHMSPRADIMEWRDGDFGWNSLTPSYVNTGLNAVIEADSNKKIKYWVYGHTHQRQLVEIDGIIYANNARGYPRENPPFTLTQIEAGV